MKQTVVIFGLSLLFHIFISLFFLIVSIVEMIVKLPVFNYTYINGSMFFSFIFLNYNIPFFKLIIAIFAKEFFKALPLSTVRFIIELITVVNG